MKKYFYIGIAAFAGLLIGAGASVVNAVSPSPINFGGTNNISFSLGNTWFDGTKLTSTSSAFTVGSIIGTTTSTSTLKGPVTLATTTTSSLNGVIVVDGIHYPATGRGVKNAIADASAFGARQVYVPAGTYSFASGDAIVFGGQSIKLIGAGASSTIFKANGVGGGIIYDHTNDTDPTYRSNIEISGITFDSNTQTTVVGVSMGSSNDLYIHDSEFLNAKTIQSVIIGNIGGTLGSEKASDVATSSSKNFVFQHNTVASSTSGTAEVMLCVDCRDSRIVNNTFRDNLGGAAVLALYGYNRNVQIANNTFANNRIKAMYVQESDHISVEDNNIYSATGYFPTGLAIINSSDVTVQGNIIKNYQDGATGADGIDVYDNSSTFDGHASMHASSDRLLITGNVIKDFYTAILIPSTVGVGYNHTQQDIVISNNQLGFGLWSPIIVGNAKATGMKRIKITGNVASTTKEFDQGMISIFGSTTAQTNVSDIEISGNYTALNSAGGNSAGIYVDGASAVRIFDNYTKGTARGTYADIQITANNTNVTYNAQDELYTTFGGGKVGIGTTTPGSLLSLQGIANFTTATSTFYGAGINLTAGCFSINNVCVGSGTGSGSVTQINTTDGSLTGGPITTTGTLSLNPAHSNWWTALQNFTNASTSKFTATSSVWLATGGGNVLIGTTTTRASEKFVLANGTYASTSPSTQVNQIYGATAIDDSSGLFVNNSGSCTVVNCASTEIYATNNGMNFDSSPGSSNTNGNFIFNRTGTEYARLSALGALALASDGTYGPASTLDVNGNGTIGAGYKLIAAPTNGLLVQGNVGIGTTSPNWPLSVSGIVAAASFIGTTTATSTLGGGIDIATGCFAVNHVCVGGSGGAGTVTQVNTTYPVTGGGFTTSGTIALAFGTTTSNTWGGTQTFSSPLVDGTLSGLIAANSGTTYAAATSSLGVTGPITFSGTMGAQVGGANGSFGCATCLTGNQTITLSGDVTGSGSTAITTVLAGLRTLGNLWFDGTNITSTSSKFTVGSIIATTTATSTFKGPLINGNGDILTQQATLTVSTSTATGQYTDIQTAINQLSTIVPGGTVHVRCGTYTITSPIIIAASSTVLEGEGVCTKIAFNGATVPKAIGISTSTVEDVTLRDFFIYQTNATAQGIGIDASNTPLLYANNIKIQYAGTSTSIQDTADKTFYQNWTNMDFRDNKSCVDIGGSNNLSAGSHPTVENMMVNMRCALLNGQAGFGIYVDSSSANGSQNWNFINPDIEMPGVLGSEIGIYLKNAQNTVIENPFLEDMGTGIKIDAASNRTTIIGGQFLNNTANVTDNGIDTVFQNSQVGSTLYNKFAPFEIFDKAAGRMAMFIHNATTFANTLTDYIKLALVNVTDTANLLNLSNAGSGATLIATSSRGTDLVLLGSNGNVGFGTATPGTLLSLGNTGASTINISPSATSTFGKGINVLAGCLAVNGTCVTGTGGSGTVTSVAGGKNIFGGTITTSGTLTAGNQQASYIVSTTTATGDFTDVQSAINALPSGGGLIHVKCGTYTLPSAGTTSAGINIKVNGTIIEGEGICTQFNFTRGTTVNAIGWNAININNTELREFYIHQTDAASFGQTVGINASNTPILNVNNIKIDQTATSTMIRDTNNQSFYQHFSFMDLRDNTTCFDIGGGGSSNPVNDSSLEHIRCALHSGNKGSAVYADQNGTNGAQAWLVSDFEQEPTGTGTGLTCFNLVVAIDWQINNAYCEFLIATPGAGWKIGANSQRVTFNGGEFLYATSSQTNAGANIQFLNTDVEGGAVNALTASTSISLISSNDASVPSFSIYGNTNWAQSKPYIYLHMVNGSDTGVPISIVNEGGGNSIRVDDVAGDTTPFVLDPSGKVGISSSTPYKDFSLVGGFAWTSGSTSASAQNVVCVNTNTGEVIQDTSPATPCASSLRALKDNIVSDPLGLDAVLHMRPVQFTWKLGNAPGHFKDNGAPVDSGFIAEDMQAISPLLADYDDKGKLSSIKPTAILAATVNAIQQQQAEIEALGGSTKKAMTDNWQWFALGLLSLYVVYNEVDKRRK